MPKLELKSETVEGAIACIERFFAMENPSKDERLSAFDAFRVVRLAARITRPPLRGQTHPCGYCGAPFYEDGEPAFEDHPHAREKT